MARSVPKWDIFKEEKKRTTFIYPALLIMFHGLMQFDLQIRLSSLSQLKPCYVFNGSDVVWVEEHKCQGYRLPTEAEWEYAARSKNPDTFRYPGKHTAYRGILVQTKKPKEYIILSVSYNPMNSGFMTWW